MPTIKETTVFSYDELDEWAKQRVRDWYLETSMLDFEPDCLFDDFERICEILGVTLSKRYVPLMNGKTRGEPVIYWSGFYSQGDGACFEGSYSYAKGSVAKIKAYVPQDKELHDIAEILADVQRRNFYQLSANVAQQGRYFYMTVKVERDSANYQSMTADAEDVVTQAMRDLADWLYHYLRKEYDYQTSREQVEESILANEYEFTEEGDRA